MTPPSDNQAFERAQRFVDRRRLLIGLCAAVAVALLAGLLGVLTRGDDGRRVTATESAQATPATTGVPVVNPVIAEPQAAPLPESPTTTVPALVLGSSFARPTATVPQPAPRKAPPTTAKSAQAPAPSPSGKPAPGATAPFCHDSFDPACGPFHWQPAPAQNQPRQVTLSSQSQTVPAGAQVTFHSVVNDPDDSQAFKCPTTTYDFGDVPSSSTHCDPPPNVDPCPKRYGPWTPPEAAPGGGQEDVAHTFSTPGTYTVKFRYDPGYEDACYNPYADGAEGSIQITVIGP
jgi:hypothetical protein